MGYWKEGVWDDDVDEDAGEPVTFKGLDKWGSVAATNPNSSKLYTTFEEPSPLTELSANGFGGESCWLGCCCVQFSCKFTVCRRD